MSSERYRAKHHSECFFDGAVMLVCTPTCPEAARVTDLDAENAKLREELEAHESYAVSVQETIAQANRERHSAEDQRDQYANTIRLLVKENLEERIPRVEALEAQLAQAQAEKIQWEDAALIEASKHRDTEIELVKTKQELAQARARAELADDYRNELMFPLGIEGRITIHWRDYVMYFVSRYDALIPPQPTEEHKG